MKLTFILFISLTFLIGCSKQDQKPVTSPSMSSAVDKIVVKEENQPILDESGKATFCSLINKSFVRYRWGQSDCEREKWLSDSTSVLGTPLVWTIYGDKKNPDTTLILCGVHGDEITPVKFCFDIINHLRTVSLIGEGEHFKNDFEGRRVVVVPVANPDSFFKRRPTRTNANGVDVNRNLPTKDFDKKALRLWKSRYRSDKRRYPGKVAMSEPESVFQVELIKKFKPKKIISVHSPLTMLDYDGPANEHSGGVVGSSANELLITMSEEAKGYRIKNYPFFPGSLGNYAGNERQIPTFTLELPTSDPSKSKAYWKRFKGAIHAAMTHDIK